VSVKSSSAAADGGGSKNKRKAGETAAEIYDIVYGDQGKKKQGKGKKRPRTET